jgi:prepilin-type N-terminal cleavage/methylation domain-containing protein
MRIFREKKLTKILAFSLIELLVVVAIIGIILAMTIFGLQGSRASARDAQRKADLESIRSALEMYKADHNTYPISTGCSWNWVWGGCQDPWIPGLAPEYISEIPLDVRQNDSYVGDSPHRFNYNYRCVADASGNCYDYRLLTQLENADDSAINGGDYGYWAEYVYVVVKP